MIDPKNFTTLPNKQKRDTIIDLIKNSYQNTKNIKKLYLYLTSDLAISDQQLETIYTTIYKASKEEQTINIQQNIKKTNRRRNLWWTIPRNFT